ncbi:unnamed protein product [Prunus brigantina]
MWQWLALLQLPTLFLDDSEFQRSPGLVAKMALRSKVSNVGMKTSLDQGKDFQT